MKSRNFGEVFKNALGTVFLLAAAFFVCSTFLSMRTALADPLPGADLTTPVTTSAARATTTSPRSAARATPSRAGGAVTPSRTTASGRAVATRTTAAQTPARTVATRTAVAPRQTARTVVSRSATPARVSMVGTANRAPAAAINTSSNYQYLSSKLYTGSYSNIVDPATGLISADAYANCMESYYTCMDEICTARNSAQRRCACAGRVRAFSEAERQLEIANEELIKVSGELALLIATKGKDVSSAFQLTEAEQVMNCVAWRDASQNGTDWTDEYDTENGGIDWCKAHGIYDSSCSASNPPKYCKPSNNTFGFDVDNLDGNSSDILASLKAWADAKEKTFTIIENDADSLFDGLLATNSVVNGLTGVTGIAIDERLKDSLAETWGYELFEYAHNNVCSRVLDSCFNGIYEACGSPPSTGRKCTSGAGQCPFNYNSQITVKHDSGQYDLNFITGNTQYTASNSASCFGYTSASGDPYKTLRGPVADARRSVMQKYALDANADCDLYGDQLRTTAQNIGYQKVAAQQALQKKRLEFAQEEEKSIATATNAASTNFSECISELWECYMAQDDANLGRTGAGVWTTSRIKTYCATVANSPSCYAEMICNPSRNQFKAVIDTADNMSCDTSLAANTMTNGTLTYACRNVVTLNEILNGTGATAADVTAVKWPDTGANSMAQREKCIQDALGCSGNTCPLRNWTATTRQ